MWIRDTAIAYWHSLIGAVFSSKYLVNALNQQGMLRDSQNDPIGSVLSYQLPNATTNSTVDAQQPEPGVGRQHMSLPLVSQ